MVLPTMPAQYAASIAAVFAFVPDVFILSKPGKPDVVVTADEIRAGAEVMEGGTDANHR